MTEHEPGHVEYHMLDVEDAKREALRICTQNPVWAKNINDAFCDAVFVEAAKANRINFLHLDGAGSVFYTWTRAGGLAGLDIMSGKTPTPEQWRSSTGALYLCDICFTPEAKPSRAVRAVISSMTAHGIAKNGEPVYYLRTTPGKPERIGWITAR